MLRCAAALCLLALPAHAETWVAMTGSQIEAALNDQTLDYKDAWQTFNASGTTLYNAGRDSWGAWRVQGDQYCSEWPPNAGWVCYDMARDLDNDRVKFIGQHGDETIGWFRR